MASLTNTISFMTIPMRNGIFFYYSLTSSCLVYGQKSSVILVLGNCEGKLYFFEINNILDQCSATKVDEMLMNQVISTTNHNTVPKGYFPISDSFRYSKTMNYAFG